jgi:hypothetical protein
VDAHHVSRDKMMWGALLVSILVFQNALQDLQFINVPPNTLKKTNLWRFL